MNVYDFDRTIYDGDSSIDFYLYCIQKKPSIFFKSIIIQLSGIILYAFRRISKERYKEKYFSFLKYISVDDELLNRFWNEKSNRIKQWYLAQKQNRDVIISASPEFLLKPICKRLDVSLIASRVDSSTGIFTGKNCHGQEKVRRFREKFPGEKIDEFYTDSKVDYPLAEISTSAFLVNRQKIRKLQ